MPTNLQEQVLEDAEALATFGNLYSKLKNKFPKSYYFTDELIEKDFIETTAKRYFGSSPVKLIRKNLDGVFVPSYFNIDFVRIQVDLLGRLYSTPNNLIDALKSEGHAVVVNNHIENEDIPLDIRMQTDEDFQEATMLQREDLIAKLQEEETIAARERLARNLMIQRCSRQNSLFLEHFIELQKYVPFDLLVEKLGEYDNNTDYNKFYNYVIFWTLEDPHPLKTTIQEIFPINGLFTGVQLTEKFNSIYSGLLNHPNLTPKKAFTLIKSFCTLSERTSMRINGRPVPAYRILNLNPFGLEGEPLERISASTSVVHLLRF